MIPRNKQHFIVMSTLYSILVDFNYNKKDGIRKSSEIIDGMMEEYGESAPDYIKDCVNLSLINYGEIVKAFTPLLKNWTWERIPLITQAILIMSYTHFYKLGPIDKRIVIDVAVNLAKEYIEEKQAKFINGILEKALEENGK
jgi:N utilization substance protein B